MNLTKFRSRVRMLNAVRGSLWGLLAGGIIAATVAALMVTHVVAPSGPILAASLLIGLLVGLVAGTIRRVGDSDLFRSIDRRAELSDRLASAQEIASNHQFSDELKGDASIHFSQLVPKQVFPVRWRKSDALIAVPPLCALGLFLLATLPVNLTPEQQQEKAAMKRAAVQVERIAKPVMEAERQGTGTPDEKRLAQELNKLQQNLREATLEREAAMEKMNELGRQSEKLSQNRGEQAMDSLQSAQESLAKAAMSEMEKDGSAMSLEDLKAMRDQLEARRNQRKELADEREQLQQKLNDLDAKLKQKSLSDQERMALESERDQLQQQLKENQDAQRALQSEMQKQTQQSAESNQEQKQLLEGQQKTLQDQQSALQNKMDNLKNQLNRSDLSPEQRKQMEEMMRKMQEALKGLEKELAEVQKAMQELMNNEKIREMLEKLNSNPEMQKLREMMAKMQQDAQRSEQGEAPQLTKEDLEAMKEQIEQMKEELEELAEQLKDPEAMKQFIKDLQEAIKNQEMCNGMGMLGMGLPLILGVSGMPGMPGASFLDEDQMSVDTQKVNHSERDKQINARTATGAVKGQRSSTGAETYIEVRGPTSVGNRTSVPYSKVLPSYRQRAEQALKNRKIPKQHEKRVKAYFDSLEGKR